MSLVTMMKSAEDKLTELNFEADIDVAQMRGNTSVEALEYLKMKEQECKDETRKFKKLFYDFWLKELFAPEEKYRKLIEHGRNIR